MLTSGQCNQSRRNKIFLIDDHPIVRQGLALLINREVDLVVCGDAEGAPSALTALETAEPDLVIVDISLNGPDGLDLLKTIRLKDPHVPVLVLSTPGFLKASFCKGNCRHLLYYHELSNFTGEAPRSPEKR
jgi:DNA-binding NtrC family response regulator